MKPFNYFNVMLSAMTAHRARSMGIPVSRDYGYAVVSSQLLPGYNSRLYSWCKTKDIAERSVETWEYSKKRGFHACPCGSDKQARACCGIPAEYQQPAQ